MTREEFHALALAIEDALFAADLKPTELLVARLIVKLSLRSERTTTPQLRQKDFAEFAGIRETHIAETIGWLMGRKVIEMEAPNVYRPNPSIAAWLVRERVTAAAKAREAELLRLAPEFFRQEEIRAGDPRVAFPDAELAAAGENFRNSEVLKLRNPEVGGGKTSEIRKSGGASCTARARHEHESSATQSMSCMHVPGGGGGEENSAAARCLEPKHFDLLEQIEELTREEGRAADFRRTWEGRVLEDEVRAFKTIAETKVMKREGRIRRSIGGTLNWNWNYFGARNLVKKARMLLWL